MDTVLENGLKFKLNHDERTASVIESTKSADTICIPPFIEHNGTRYIISSIERAVIDNNNQIERIILPDKSVDDIFMNQIRLLERQLGEYRYIEPFQLESAQKDLNIEDFIVQMRQLQEHLLTYLDGDKDDQDNYSNLIIYLNDNKIVENPKLFKEFLYLISKISTNHHRNEFFIEKIQKLIFEYKLRIKQTLSIQEIFQLFVNNKLIILYLFSNQIIPKDPSFFQQMYKIIHKNGVKYCHFFYDEIRIYLDLTDRWDYEEEVKDINHDDLINFYSKRLKGENDSYICELIRNDSIVDFIVHINKTNTSLDETIKASIFETNEFLLKKNPSLIEYAAFFGSIQIFQYLIVNNIELKPSLWLYAIHSNNPEIIQILEQRGIKPEDDNYDMCYKEAIKCHHNDIANYIYENFLDQQVEKEKINNNFSKNVVCYAFHYHNFAYFPNKLNDNEFIFHYACKYDYFNIVEYLLTTQKIDVNKVIIFNFTFFFLIIHEIFLIFFFNRILCFCIFILHH